MMVPRPPAWGLCYALAALAAAYSVAACIIAAHVL